MVSEILEQKVYESRLIYHLNHRMILVDELAENRQHKTDIMFRY